MDWPVDAWMTWLGIAAIAAIVEILLPGVFLGFLAFGAAATAILSLVLPDLTLPGQLISVAAWTGVAIAIGHRWYGNDQRDSSDPLLNDRARRLEGASAIVSLPISAGEGRVRIGDGEWPARGPDAAAGTPMRVVRIDSGVAIVAPLSASEPQP